MKPQVRSLAAASAVALLLLAGCSKSGGTTSSSSMSSSAPAAAVVLTGDIAFNQDNLKKLDDEIQQALDGKDLSGVNIAMVVNVAADYWNAGKVGFQAGCTALGISSKHCTFFAPPDGKLTEQTSELETLRSQGVTGYSISAIDPKSAATTIANDMKAGTFVLPIDSPLPDTAAKGLYLGTPNYTAGYTAGKAMRKLLGDQGKIAILVGSLTAANATQRISGFEDALKGSGISVAQKVNDNLSASTATTDAETILANNPGINGLYGVYSYDGPALAQAVEAAGKADSVKIVSDDTDAQTMSFIGKGVIGGTVVQMPYQQGYTGAYILAAEKVLGEAQTMQMIKPYLADDGSTLSSGVGLVTKSNLSDYQSLVSQLGIG